MLFLLLQPLFADFGKVGLALHGLFGLELLKLTFVEPPPTRAPRPAYQPQIVENPRKLVHCQRFGAFFVVLLVAAVEVWYDEIRDAFVIEEVPADPLEACTRRPVDGGIDRGTDLARGHRRKTP